MKCEICKREFKNSTSLVSHLSNKRNSCHIKIKEYYDKFLKKESEGICQFCGRETLFYGIEKGYKTSTCKHCRNKKPESKELRRKTFLDKKEKKKIENGYYNLPIDCEICKEKGIISKWKSKKHLSKHIGLSHKEVKLKDYYDKFFKIDPNEGICSISGNQTMFMSLHDGYRKFYGKGTNSSDLSIKEKKKETLFKNHGVKFPCYVNTEERILKQRKTNQKRIKLKNIRIKLIGLLKILSIDKNNKLQCQICGEVFASLSSLSIHVPHHNIKMKQYYDQFFKLNENEGICPISGLDTTFICLEKGYCKYHNSVLTLTEEIKNGNKINQLKYIKNQIKRWQNNYNVEFLDIDNINLIGDLTKIKCLKCGLVYENRFTNLKSGYGKCPKCFPRDNTSSIAENEILTDIKTYLPNEEFLTNFKGLIKNPTTGYPLELDIYIPSKKFAIEYNGIYWHSEEIQGEKAPYTHLIKWEECRKQGIQLFQIFEDEYNQKKEIILSMIKHKLGFTSNKTIYARKCTIKEIIPKEKNIFLDNNHIQGRDSSRIKLGAFFENELIGVMTFGLGNITRGGRPDQTKKWELSRFATKKECLVIGIGGKLLEYFKRHFDWEEIYSYADLRFSTGNIYQKLGFELISQSQPNYFYVKNGTRIHRFNLRKLPHEPVNIPEWKLRLDQGYVRIWDCGSLKFSLKNEQKNNGV